eukprot:TRINITY_DN16332_c0_g1_i1.p1 TRINITY_DN16332_c0_g1~~TRINITY_DN16332_c0_g1_i1.p1  ORF type:complete len:213 (+),score=40.25 TRINITY_DN16332_c0_g1_i1:40-639(+)
MSQERGDGLEGPARRRKQACADDFRRSMKAEYPHVPEAKLRDVCKRNEDGLITKERVEEILEEETKRIVHDQFTSSSDTKKVMLYVTKSTADRHVRYKCSRLQLSFDCLQLNYEEVDVSGNKWLRKTLSDVSKCDELPLVFVGEGADGKFAGAYDIVLQKIDDGKIYDFLQGYGYVHPRKKQKHFIFDESGSHEIKRTS